VQVFRTNILLWVVCGVGKDTRVEPSFNTVHPCDDYTVLVGMQESIVQENVPQRVEQFTLAVGEKGSKQVLGPGVTRFGKHPVLEFVWELEGNER
jgi:hypothetical protein